MTIDSTIPKFVADRLHHAIEQLEPFAQHFGEPFDFSIGSLGRLDVSIRDGWPECDIAGNPGGYDLLVELFGTYFGETLRRLFGGSWVHEDDTSMPFLKGPHHPDCVIYPYSVIYQRFAQNKSIQPWVEAYCVASSPTWQPS